ncbi:hypothetical protein PR048_011261 [Dryococelus australis]|uniref:Uncharacterized protein n=1 Tax=Dryococelus australis TaxID=614101 RepID=A0ABQ9HL97_9NEOP|nr:hypothetical protein PR048_011261 [Dryococelus australis]
MDISCSSTVSQDVTQHVNIQQKQICFLKMPNETKAITDILNDPTSTPHAVAQAGEGIFLTMYQAPPSECDLNNHRYNSFVKSSTKIKANFASLPSTKGAAKQHSIRVHLKTQQCLDNDSLNPEHWGSL